jgi:hypothetical protein
MDRVVEYCFDNPNPGPGRYPQFCENGRQVWVTGEYGWISKTTDWGETWQPQGGGSINWLFQSQNAAFINQITLHSIYVSAPLYAALSLTVLVWKLLHRIDTSDLSPIVSAHKTRSYSEQ